MPIAIGRPQVVEWHEQAKVAFITMASVTFFVGALLIDRRPPFEYISTEITPRYSYPGTPIAIHRHVIWHRRCQGEAWTEVVSGPDRIITNYDRGTRMPFELGDVRADRTIILSPTIQPGTATYRGVIKFHNCGLTSRWKPIEIPYQEVNFEVR